MEISGGPSSDEYFFRHEFVPAAGAGGQVRLIDSAFVQAMREGWTVMIDEANTVRDVALLSLNATLDGRLALYLPATAETVDRPARVRAPAGLQPGPGRRDRPARRLVLALPGDAGGHEQLGPRWSRSARRSALVAAATSLDRRRIAGDDGLAGRRSSARSSRCGR